MITTLPITKNASPIFAKRKQNGKLRLLFDLRKINTFIADDYINNNHPVSSLSDAAQHMAEKNLLCKLDCSQAYHCLQMTKNQSNFLHLTSRVEHLHTEDWQEDLVVPFQRFRGSSAGISIQSSKLTIVHKILMILA